MMAHRREQRFYPALEAWRRAKHRGETFACSDPLYRAACYEANAAELDALADAAPALLAKHTWRRAAADEMAVARRILADAERRRRARSAETAHA